MSDNANSGIPLSLERIPLYKMGTGNTKSMIKNYLETPIYKRLLVNAREVALVLIPPEVTRDAENQEKYEALENQGCRVSLLVKSLTTPKEGDTPKGDFEEMANLINITLAAWMADDPWRERTVSFFPNSTQNG